MKARTWLLALLLAAPDLEAQASADSATAKPPVMRVVVRSVTGYGASAGLVFVGAALGAHLEGPCGCDDPGMQGALIGATVGFTLGSILAPAIPRLGSKCSGEQRVRRALFGVAGTVAAGAVAAAVTDGRGFALVLGAPIGAAMAQGRC